MVCFGLIPYRQQNACGMVAESMGTRDTAKWVMLTLFASFNWYIPRA